MPYGLFILELTDGCSLYCLANTTTPYLQYKHRSFVDFAAAVDGRPLLAAEWLGILREWLASNRHLAKDPESRWNRDGYEAAKAAEVILAKYAKLGESEFDAVVAKYVDGLACERDPDEGPPSVPLNGTPKQT